MADQMKMKKWVNNLLLIIAVIALAGTCAAAIVEYPEESEELLRISNILLQGARGRGRGDVREFVDALDGDKLSCTASGQPCNVWGKSTCCPGTACNAHPPRGDFCEWCPGAGDPCGILDGCCPGLTCDGYFDGRCH